MTSLIVSCPPLGALVRAALLALVLLAGLLPTPAAAIDFADYFRGRDAAGPRINARDRVRPKRKTAGHNVAKGRATPISSEPLPATPLVLVISLEQQRLSVYSQGKLIETTVISSGTASDPTPTGVFAVIEKNERHFSNLYNGAPMPFMQRLTMSGVALHSGHVTGRPASHGCVRLPHEYARRLFSATKLGVRVIVSTDNPEPVDVANMRLLEPERIAVATRRAHADTAGAAAGTLSDSGNAPPARASADKSIDPRTGRPKGPMALQRDEVLRAAPVSILVSRADQKVYVRHMFEPVIEMPITLSEPSRPIGTHVYTLAEMEADGSAQRWSAISPKLAQRRLAAARVLARHRGRSSRAVREPVRAVPVADEGTASTAVEAVERFALPPEVIVQIAPLLRPGASLIVTDLPQSRRTQTGWTDVIVTP